MKTVIQSPSGIDLVGKLHIESKADPRIIMISRGFDRFNLPWIGEDQSIDYLFNYFKDKGANVFVEERFRKKKSITTSNMLEDERQWARYFIENNHDQIHSLGISYGALISLLLSLEFNEIRKTFLRSPMSDLPGMIKGAYTQEMSPTAQEYFKRVYNFFTNFIKDGINFDIQDKLKKLNKPVMVHHSKRDRLIPFTQTHTLLQLLPISQFIECIGTKNHECARNGNYQPQAKMMYKFFNT